MPNTTAPQLTTDYVAQKSLTVLQNRCAPFAAFSRNFGSDPLKPKAKVQVSLVTAGGTAQENATNFQDKDNFRATIDAVEVEVNRITVGGHLTPDERDGGRTFDEFVEMKVGELTDKLWDKVAALLTEGNYGAAHPCVPAAFGFDDIGELWEAIAKCGKKSLVLDKSYFRRLLPTTLQNFNLMESGTGLPGWAGTYLATKWDASGENIRGFAAGPQAIALAAGLPLLSPNALVNRRVIVLPEIGLNVSFDSWYDTAEKCDWFNWEVMFGAEKGVASALKLLKQP